MTYFSPKPLTDSEKKTLKESGEIFSDEAIQSLCDLGNVLYDIRQRMISEGWKIDHNQGIWISPDGVSYTKETMGQYHEDLKKKRKAELLAKRQRKNG